MCPTLRSPKIWEKGRAETEQRKRIISDMTRKWSWCYRGKKGADGTYFPRDASRKHAQLHKPSRQIPEKKKRNQEKSQQECKQSAKLGSWKDTQNVYTKRVCDRKIFIRQCRYLSSPANVAQLHRLEHSCSIHRSSHHRQKLAGRGAFFVLQWRRRHPRNLRGLHWWGLRKIQDQWAGDPGVMKGEKLANGKRSTDDTR